MQIQVDTGPAPHPSTKLSYFPIHKFSNFQISIFPFWKFPIWRFPNFPCPCYGVHSSLSGLYLPRLEPNMGTTESNIHLWIFNIFWWYSFLSIHHKCITNRGYDVSHNFGWIKSMFPYFPVVTVSNQVYPRIQSDLWKKGLFCIKPI